VKKTKSQSKKPLVNRRARFDYELGEKITAGIMLSGPEVRGARLGHVRLTGAYANLKQNELWLTNMSISIPDTARGKEDEKERTDARKLLVTKKELQKIEDAKKQGLTIVPTRLFNEGRFVKIELSFAKGKKIHDKRQSIKERDQAREAKRIVKGSL
jgi:SsrA-binding protein